jgi:hypothetical protein
MKIFVFENVDQLTYSYHSGGGMVIVAKDLEQAKSLIADDKDCVPTQQEWDSVIVYETIYDTEPRVFIFPDAGCC